MSLLAIAITQTVMAVATDTKAVLATCVVVSGLFIGVTNTLITQTVMTAAPVDRGVASAAYSFTILWYGVGPVGGRCARRAD
jgi:hypothetical protein